MTIIRYFPSPYPDESILSLFVRYSKRVGNSNFYSSVQELLGKMYKRVNLLFAGNLEYMYSNFPKESDLTPDYFIINHTAMPFYKPFIPEDRYIKLLCELKNGNLIAVQSGLGITAGSIIQNNGVKYCRYCLDDDRVEYGEAYIHRTHQLQGVFICPKHNSTLMTVKGNTDSCYDLFDLNEYCNMEGDITFRSKANDELFLIATDVAFLLDNQELIGNLETVIRKYNCCMHEKNYMSPSGLVNQVKLQKDFKEFYSEEFLTLLNSEIVINDESNWLRLITRKKVKVVHPIRHLLFIRFLFGDIQHFIEYEKEIYRPFGEPPFPCMNIEVNHYKMPLIYESNSIVKTNHHTSKAIGIFSCPQCGHTYTLNAEEYRTCGFNRVRHKKINNSDKTDRKLVDKGNKYQTKLKEKYIFEISELISNECNLSRREIIKKSNKAYRWLYKHDREWLESKIPGHKKHKEFYRNTRINWSLRDKENLERVRIAIQNLYKKTPPIRITINQISKECEYF